MRSWNIFFSIVTVVIVTTMVMPRFFGLQSFTQWGGMYTDGWCSAHTAAESTVDLGRPPTKEEAEEFFGSPTTRSVWSAPMQNLESCLRWGQSWCGKEHRPGWRIYHVQPYFRGEYPWEYTNVCDLPQPDPPWFYQHIL